MDPELISQISDLTQKVEELETVLFNLMKMSIECDAKLEALIEILEAFNVIDVTQSTSGLQIL
jgi:hypothetical protein